MTALGASIGTGNIAGVATAIVTGGPGALFWIWVYGFFATAIKFTEAVLGIRYRRLVGDRLSAGPMHYLRDGVGSPALAWTYAAIAAVAALTTTPMSQPNSIAVAWKTVLGVPQWATGVGLAVLTWLVVIGGVTSIGRAAEKLAPAKVFLYLAGGLVVIVTHSGHLPAVLSLVVREALSIGAVTGGTRATASWSPCATASRAGSTRTRPATARRRRLRDRPQRPAGAAGAERRDGGVHRVVRDLHHQRADHPGQRGLAVGIHEQRRRGGGVQLGDAVRGRLDPRLLRVPVRLHDAHRLGLLRRAVPRVRVRARASPSPTAGSTAASSCWAPPARSRRCGPGATS
jgi:hypothetical protein